MSWMPALAIAGLLTFAIRVSFIALLGRVETPPLLSRALRFVPPAVLSAIVLPELLVRQGRVDFSLQNLRMLAGLVALLVAWRTRSVLFTIAAGMATLWALQAMSAG
jgi:branched-subunit amino acid transport protein